MRLDATVVADDGAKDQLSSGRGRDWFFASATDRITGRKAPKDREAKAVYDETRRIDKIDTEHFAAAFAFTAIPARYTLERRQWAEASELTLHPRSLSWAKFPQAESILVFARGLGAAWGGNVAAAKRESARLRPATP